MFRAVLLTVIVIVVLSLAYHIIFPMLGVGEVITAGVWTVALVSIVMISLVVALMFVLPALFIILAIVIVLVWTVFAIALFPFLFPLMAPLLIIMILIAYLNSRKKKQLQNKSNND